MIDPMENIAQDLRDTFPDGGLSSLSEINGFDVVRAEFLSPTFKPKITLNVDRLVFSASCVRLLPDYNYVQMLLDRIKKRVVLLPCSPYDKDAHKWSNKKGSGVAPRQIPAPILCGKLFDFLNWTSDFRYKVMAVYQRLEGRELIVFNLLEYEMVVPEQIRDAHGDVIKIKRRPVYPIDWRESFGIAYSEHKDTFSVNLNDYYLLSDKDATDNKGNIPPSLIQGEVPTASDIITRQYYKPERSGTQ